MAVRNTCVGQQALRTAQRQIQHELNCCSSSFWTFCYFNHQIFPAETVRSIALKASARPAGELAVCKHMDATGKQYAEGACKHQLNSNYLDMRQACRECIRLHAAGEPCTAGVTRVSSVMHCLEGRAGNGRCTHRYWKRGSSEER